MSNGDEKYLRTVNEINEHFLNLSKPKNLDGDSSNNIVVQFEVQFAELCIAVQTSGAPDPENMTVLKFYSALKYFDTKNKKIQEQKQRNNENNRSGRQIRR